MSIKEMMILKHLANASDYPYQIGKALDLSIDTVRWHLKRLENAGIVSSRKGIEHNAPRFFSLTEAGKKYLKKVEKVLD